MPRFVCGLALILFIALPAIAADDEPLDQSWHVRPGKNHSVSPGISGDRVWVAQMSGALYGLDPKTGEVMVSAQVPGKIYGGLTATDDGIYVAAGKAIHCIDPKTGKLQWRYDFGAPCSLEPAVDGDHVLAGSRRGHIALLDAKTGREVWKRDVDFSPDRIALAGDIAILSAGGGQEEGLYVLDRKTGKTRWKAPYPGKQDGLHCTGFAIGKGVVYYGDAALDLADETPVWRLKQAARFFTAGRRAVVAVIEVVKAFPDTTLAGYRAQKLLATLLSALKMSLSCRNLPDIPFGLRSPDGMAILGEVLTAKPLDPDTIAARGRAARWRNSRTAPARQS